MVRQTLDEAARTAKKLPAELERPVRAVVVCGMLAADTLREAFAPFNAIKNLELEILPVENTSLGRK